MTKQSLIDGDDSIADMMVEAEALGCTEDGIYIDSQTGEVTGIDESVTVSPPILK